MVAMAVNSFCIIESLQIFKDQSVGLNDVPPRSVGKCGMAQALAITSGGIGVSTAVETVINPYQDILAYDIYNILPCVIPMVKYTNL